MPLFIEKAGITGIPCDAMVNSTDRIYSGSGGTDLAIHRAAGKKLDEACRLLPPLSVGEVSYTEGFDLPCRYVVHTVGPAWQGGNAEEAAILQSCYRNVLLLCRKLGCTSVVFPLISSGRSGFPKELVLKLAADAISDFLYADKEEMQVTLCIDSKNEYIVPGEASLISFLNRQEEAAEKRSFLRREGFPGLMSRAPRATPGKAKNPGADACREEVCREEAYGAAVSAPVIRKGTLADWLKKHDDSFAVTLLKLIDRKGMTEVECYKRANVGRKTFSKIVNEADYRPSKRTVLSFAVALSLTLSETEALLKTVGFSLSHSTTFDLILEYYIGNGIYDIYEINAALYQYDQPCLGCS